MIELNPALNNMKNFLKKMKKISCIKNYQFNLTYYKNQRKKKNSQFGKKF